DGIRDFHVTGVQTCALPICENSRFWLVSPRVSASGVSNLGTLISGIYIVMDPGKPGGFQDVFTGLTEPPAIQSDDQGTQYVLLEIGRASCRERVEDWVEGGG